MADDNGTTSPGSRPTINIFVEAMAKAQAALQDGVPMAEDSTWEELMAYHHLLRNTHEQLQETRQRLDERKRLADASSLRWAQLSSTNYSSAHTPAPRQPRFWSRVNLMPEASRQEISKSLDSSFMTVDMAGNVMPKTPQGAVLAATTYLQSIQPPEGDPRAPLHRQTIIGLGMVGDSLMPKEGGGVGPLPAARRSHRTSPHRERSPRQLASSRREVQPRTTRGYVDHDQGKWDDARNHITQKKVDKSRAAHEHRESSDRESSESSDDDVEPCGVRCFSRRIRESKMPRGFKLPSDTPKYDGLQEPALWLEDYLTAVRLQKGNKITTM
jgi:hypothetical protein